MNQEMPHRSKKRQVNNFNVSNLYLANTSTDGLIDEDINLLTLELCRLCVPWTIFMVVICYNFSYIDSIISYSFHVSFTV